MIFEFNQQLMPQNLIEIDEIGQFGIEAWNDEGYYYYLISKTIFGTTLLATCGPVVPDIDILPAGFRMELDKIPYKEDKIAKAISMFLNDRKKAITHAELLTVDDAIAHFREMKPYIESFSAETL